MNDYLGYLLNLDDPTERRRIEDRLREDPQAVREIELWRQVAEPLSFDRDEFVPPAGLVDRTMARLDQHIQTHRVSAFANALNGPSAPPKWSEVVGVSDRAESAGGRWRRADLMVVASIAVVGFLTLFAIMPIVRHRHGLQACQNHMRKVYQALETYADTHEGRYPQVNPQAPDEGSRSFVAILQQSGSLNDPQRVACPAAGADGLSLYAYTYGYRTETGDVSGLKRDTERVGWDILPIVADRPGPDRDHRFGQNVLFCSGNVRFCTSSNVGYNRDDIYRNYEGMTGVGLGKWDSVLGVAMSSY